MDRIQVNINGGERPKSDAGRTITLFLALYLLILAFFILLVSISSVEEVKSKALMESLTSTFSSVLPPRMDLTAFNATTGDFLAADEFQRQVTGLFSTIVGIVKVDVIQPGRMMRVEMDADGLFEVDQAVIREGQYGFMDRLVAALSASPPGLRFEMEFVVPAPWKKDQTLPIDKNLSVDRAGAFARDLLARGVPPGAVSIGLKGSDEKTVEIWFHIRGIDENRIRFEDSPLIKVRKAKIKVIEPVKKAPITLQPITRSPGRISIPLPLSTDDQPIGSTDLEPAPTLPSTQNAPISLRPPSLTGGAQ